MPLTFILKPFLNAFEVPFNPPPLSSLLLLLLTLKPFSARITSLQELYFSQCHCELI